MKIAVRLIGYIIILTSCQALQAEETTKNQAMTISPGKCVVKKRGEVCSILVEFKFSLEEPGDYCVYRIDNYRPIFCFEQANYRKTQTLVEEQDTRYVLVEKAHSREVAIVDFSVLTYRPAKLRKRKKRAWGIL